ncbi:MAG: hypothetical protein EOP50_15350 [Sphingobacteriales bacterium]|nr:MAG: hypothetical protein EOP50_15350 [Sphingobacteriales bacterium]
MAQFGLPLWGEQVRLEHWAVAQRHGQLVAKNILGGRHSFVTAPFFWTRQHDTSVAYVGYGTGFDEAHTFGDVRGRDGAVLLRKRGRPVAVATVGQQARSLLCEQAFEMQQPEEIEAILAAI